MKPWFKRLLWGIGALLLLLIAVLIYVALTFDPNTYKPEVVKAVKARTGRNLVIDGPIGLTFFPKIGAAVERLSLSEPNSDQVFARVDAAAVSLALLPLLSGDVIADRIRLNGLQADLVRYKDGRTNIDDLLNGDKDKTSAEEESESTAKTPAVLDIGGIELTKANLGWRDEIKGTQLRFIDLNLNSGRIASGVPGQMELHTRIEGAQPKLALQVDLSAGYRFDFERKAMAFSNLVFKAAGDAGEQRGLEVGVKGDAVEFDPAAQSVLLSDFNLEAKSANGLQASVAVPQLRLGAEHSEAKVMSADLKSVDGNRKIELKLTVSSLETKAKTLRFDKLAVDLDFKQDALALVGKLDTPIVVDLNAHTVQLPELIGNFAVSGPNIPNKTVKVVVQGNARTNWEAEQANAEVRAKLDDSNLRLTLGLRGFDKPDMDIDLEADRLDVDRYRSKPLPVASGSKSGSKGAASGSKGETAEEPIDLGALQTVDARGGLRIGALRVAGLDAQDFNLRFDLRNGHLNAHPLTAKLYGGQLSGGFGVDAQRNEFEVKQSVANVDIGPLLRDLADKDLLEGRGNVALDVRTAGTTTSALKRALAGNASLVLKDGAFKGVNLAALLRKAKTALGSKSAAEEQAQGGEKTDFSDLTASFAIRAGIAHNEDLLLRSPFLRVTGDGDIDIGHGGMDYIAKVAVVGTSTGQDGKELADLHGLTVPVRISGPLDRLKYKVDVGAMAKDAAKQEIQRQIDKRLGGDSKDGGSKDGGSSAEKLLRDLLKKKK